MLFNKDNKKRYLWSNWFSMVNCMDKEIELALAIVRISDISSKFAARKMPSR